MKMARQWNQMVKYTSYTSEARSLSSYSLMIGRPLSRESVFMQKYLKVCIT
jgi:hypothetical protein